MQRDRVLNIVLYALLFLLLFYKALTVLDPDFGWHIRIGELITSGNFPRTDPFSYAMPSFPYFDHEWLINFLMYKVYVYTGMPGIAVVFSLLCLTSIWIVSTIPKTKSTNLLLVFLLFGSLYPYFGARPQVLSWVFAALYAKLLIFSTKLPLLLLVPFLQLIWTNVHGSFPLGLVFIFLFLVERYITTKKVSRQNVLVLLLSALVTTLNPHGVGVWKEIYLTVSDPKLSSNISEWSSSAFTATPLHTFVLVLIFVLSYVVWQKTKRTYFIPFLVFFLFIGVNNSRNIPIWSIIALPILGHLLILFRENLKTKSVINRYAKAFKFLLIFSGVLSVLHTTIDLKNTQRFREENFYPKAAVEFLKTQDISGQLFSSYNWGGYLIWQYPEKKVFIDGRMPSWRRQPAPPSESINAFEDYEAIITKKDEHKNQFAKYGVTYVLWPNKTKSSNSWLIKKIIAMLQISENEFDLIENLESANWKRIYADEVAVVYKSPTI